MERKRAEARLDQVIKLFGVWGEMVWNRASDHDQQRQIM